MVGVGGAGLTVAVARQATLALPEPVQVHSAPGCAGTRAPPKKYDRALPAGSTIGHRAISRYPLEQDVLRTSPWQGSPVSDPSLGLTMLALIVVAIMMGFPTAFTLMGLGMIFGYLAFWVPGGHWYDNRIFDLIVQRTYGVMTNDTLLSVPLFVFMGYIMERAALVDRMFHSDQLAFRRVPASLAVTTLLVCAFWGIASGIVGAVLAAALRPSLLGGATGPDGRPVGYRVIAHNLLVLSVPLLLTVGTFAATWWYVVVYNAPEVATAAAPASRVAASAAPAPVA